MTTTFAEISEASRYLEESLAAEKVVRQAQAQQVRALARFAAVGGSRRSATEEVALAFSVSRNKATTLLDVATALVARLPNTLGALDQGDIDLYKAERVVKSTKDVTDDIAAMIDQHMATRLANRDPSSIRNAANYAVQKYDPDGYKARATAKRLARHIELVKEDDTMSSIY